MLGEIARKGRHVYPTYIQAGLAWEKHELQTLKRFLRALKLPNLEPVKIFKLPMTDLAGDPLERDRTWRAGLLCCGIVQLYFGPQPEFADQSRDFLRTRTDRRNRDGAA